MKTARPWAQLCLAAAGAATGAHRRAAPRGPALRVKQIARISAIVNYTRAPLHQRMLRGETVVVYLVLEYNISTVRVASCSRLPAVHVHDVVFTKVIIVELALSLASQVATLTTRVLINQDPRGRTVSAASHSRAVCSCSRRSCIRARHCVSGSGLQHGQLQCHVRSQ